MWRVRCVGCVCTCGVVCGVGGVCVCCCGGACVWCVVMLGTRSLSLLFSLLPLLSHLSFSLLFLFLSSFSFSFALAPSLALSLALSLPPSSFLLPPSSFLLPPSNAQKKKRGNKSAFEDVWSPWFVVKTMAVDVFDTLTFVLAR